MSQRLRTLCIMEFALEADHAQIMNIDLDMVMIIARAMEQVLSIRVLKLSWILLINSSF